MLRGLTTANYFTDDVPAAVAWYTEVLGVEPWGDQRGDRWCVTPEETTDVLIASLHAQAARSRTIVENNDLSSVGQPGPRWDGAPPATLERVLFHLLQEYARHLGHLDVVSELGGGPVGE